MKKSFLLHIDSLCILDDLTDEQRGQLFNAIYKFQLGEELELTPIIKIAFSQFKNQFMRDAEKYEKTCEARKQAGSKGGKQKVANASKSKQNVANVAENDNKNKKDSDSDKDKENNILSNEKWVREYFSNNPNLNLTSALEWIAYKSNSYKQKGGVTKVCNFLSKYDLTIQQQIVDNSIMNNYKGLFEPKEQKQSTREDLISNAVDKVMNRNPRLNGIDERFLRG